MIFAADSPQGWFYFAVDGERLKRIWLPGEDLPAGADQARSVTAEGAPPWLGELVADLRAYLAGQAVDLRRWCARLDWDGLSPFQRRVYRALLEIGRGRTCTYAELAERCGSPRGARAVGAAMASNPFPPIVPCHRVVARRGLGGYGGGLGLKRRLLELEGALPAAASDARANPS